ncbi:MAG: alpha/beta fold hydrolase [Bauldia sp.]
MAVSVSRVKAICAALTLAGVLALGGCADLPEITGKEKLADIAPTGPLVGAGEVYLLRGGFNIFSTGMDELAAKLRARGVDARSYGHAQWRELAADARQRYVANHAPIVLVGHSWGVLGAVLMARELAKTSTPVALMVLYDSTDPVVVPANVKHVINLRSKAAIGAHIAVTGGYGFGGVIDIEDRPEYGHLNMDNAPALHEETIAEVLQVLAGRKTKR